jgi:hypothetical protein
MFTHSQIVDRQTHTERERERERFSYFMVCDPFRSEIVYYNKAHMKIEVHRGFEIT